MLNRREKETWAEALRSVRRGTDEQSDQQFYSLVDQVAGQVDLHVARELMGTFSDSFEEDGTQESVCAVLSTATPTVRIQALLEALPRMSTDAMNWIPTLIESEVRDHPELVVATAHSLDAQVRSILVSTLDKLIQGGTCAVEQFQKVRSALTPRK